MNQLVFISLSLLSVAYGQTAGTTRICVPIGSCINRPNGGAGIDPRIITEGCPAGQEECIGQASAASCGQRFVVSDDRIDGPVTVPGAFPWQAYIVNRTTNGNVYTGSGVLISPNVVLTIAHKVYNNRDTPGNIIVYMGVYNPTNLTQSQARSAIRVLIHPNYPANIATYKNDIALVFLNAPMPVGYQYNIGTACISSTSFVGRRCIVAGWGQTAFTAYDAPTAAQKQVTVPIVNYATCLASMSQPNVLGSNAQLYLDQNELCAGGEANKDSCTQDGGSPLMCLENSRYAIAGLVNWGKNCGLPGVYGVYVDVSKYQSWITSNMV